VAISRANVRKQTGKWMIVPNLERRFFLGTLCYDELNIGLKGRRLLMAAQLSVWKIGHGQISELTVRPFSATPQEPDEFIWLDNTGQPDESHLNQLEQQLGLHEIALDNLFDTLHNPRLLEFEDHLLLGARCLEPEDGELRLSSFGIVISKNFLITAHEEPLACFHGFWHGFRRTTIRSSVRDRSFPVSDS
jgi:Mg2+ and Co2+ transporter CorA